MFGIKQHLILFIILLLAACTGPGERQRSAFQVSEADKQAEDKILPGVQTSKPVLALLQQANDAARDGKLHTAESQLERALRIEPRNAVLWHYMAKLRLHQDRLGEAAGMAAKSNALAGRNKKLQADNWRIIAHARHQKGDKKGALEAQQKVEALLKE
ncbi:MAG: hypothetical protein OEZ39_13125 [Gammaproteobacteria bacterium]|nr:hypothetical protein [Gammaproteobacteria bacterium]MDH5652791.1 hypothetical protein [Gammaproteobacteria bacterium]